MAQNFYKYIRERSVDGQIDRIASQMARRGVNPRLYIENYFSHLESEQLLTEGWLGNFFKRIGNAWTAFWKNPNPEDTVMTRLEAAKKALSELQQMLQQNQGANPTQLSTVLRGLEQSLAIITHIEPTLKQYDQQISQFQQTGVPHSDQNDGLPQAQHQQYEQIMRERDQIMRTPDSEQKKNQLIANDDKLLAFFHQLEEGYRKMNDSDPNQAADKAKIKNFLQSIDSDTAFREIQSLLDFARRRTSPDNLLVQRPNNYTDVYFAWRKIVTTTQDQNQQKQALLKWYQALPVGNPIKAFVQKEMRQQDNMGGNEMELFWKYAVDWINKHPHHLSQM